MFNFSNASQKPYYCVVGKPINHSLSPVIHHQFADSLGITLCYERVEVAPKTLSQAISEFARLGGLGMNITVPLKEEALEVATEVTERAALAGAANTIVVREPGSYLADNTDGCGLVTDLLSNLEVVLRNQRILIIGAGGAVRGVMQPLIECSPQTISIANRTLSKADNLVNRFANSAKQYAVSLSACGLGDALAESHFDVIINATSLGLEGKTPPIPKEIFARSSFCYDMMYDKCGSTAFTKHSLESGAEHVADGLGMLVEQAAEAFRIWHGVSPDTKAVLRSLRANN